MSRNGRTQPFHAFHGSIGAEIGANMANKATTMPADGDGAFPVQGEAPETADARCAALLVLSSPTQGDDAAAVGWRRG